MDTHQFINYFRVPWNMTIQQFVKHFNPRIEFSQDGKTEFVHLRPSLYFEIRKFRTSEFFYDDKRYNNQVDVYNTDLIAKDSKDFAEKIHQVLLPFLTKQNKIDIQKVFLESIRKDLLNEQQWAVKK